MDEIQDNLKSKELPRALVISEIYPPRVGGSGNWLHEIYSRSASARTTVLAGSHIHSKDFDAQTSLNVTRANLSGEEWTLMTVSGIRYFARLYSLIVREARRSGASELHCARVFPEGLAAAFAARRLGLGLVCFVHGEDIELARASRETRWLVDKIIRRMDRIVCNSLNSRRLLEDHWCPPPQAVQVLTPGVDVNRFRPGDMQERLHLRTALGWENRRVVLTVSRLEPRKGQDTLLEALPLLRQAVPNVLYAIVGAGNEAESLKKRAARLGVLDAVVFHGELNPDDLPGAYRSCDVFALPNRQVGTSIEGFGMVLLEAQASGVPVLAGDSGGTAETLLDGQTGYIVDATDAKHLVAPLSSLLQDDMLRRRMGENARQWARDNFAWEALSPHVVKRVFLSSGDGC